MTTLPNGPRRGDLVITITFTVTAGDRRWLRKAGLNTDHGALERIALCAVREAIDRFALQGRRGIDHLLADHLE